MSNFKSFHLLVKGTVCSGLHYQRFHQIGDVSVPVHRCFMWLDQIGWVKFGFESESQFMWEKIYPGESSFFDEQGFLEETDNLFDEYSPADKTVTDVRMDYLATKQILKLDFGLDETFSFTSTPLIRAVNWYHLK